MPSNGRNIVTGEYEAIPLALVTCTAHPSPINILFPSLSWGLEIMVILARFRVVIRRRDLDRFSIIRHDYLEFGWKASGVVKWR